MTSYRAFVRVSNCWIDLEGTKKRMGAYVPVFVAADAEQLASSKARGAIEDRLARVALNEPNDAPRVVVEEIDEVPAADVPDVPPGFAWFVE